MRAWFVACDALLLEMLCYSSKSSFLLFTSSQSFFFGFSLSSTFWKILWHLARGIALLLNVKRSVGMFEHWVMWRYVWREWSFLLRLALIVFCKDNHCRTLSVIAYDWRYAMVTSYNLTRWWFKCNGCRNVKHNFTAKFGHIRPSSFFLYCLVRNVVS